MFTKRKIKHLNPFSSNLSFAKERFFVFREGFDTRPKTNLPAEAYPKVLERKRSAEELSRTRGALFIRHYAPMLAHNDHLSDLKKPDVQARLLNGPMAQTVENIVGAIHHPGLSDEEIKARGGDLGEIDPFITGNKNIIVRGDTFGKLRGIEIDPYRTAFTSRSVTKNPEPELGLEKESYSAENGRGEDTEVIIAKRKTFGRKVTLTFDNSKEITTNLTQLEYAALRWHKWGDTLKGIFKASGLEENAVNAALIALQTDPNSYPHFEDMIIGLSINGMPGVKKSVAYSKLPKEVLDEITNDKTREIFLKLEKERHALRMDIIQYDPEMKGFSEEDYERAGFANFVADPLALIYYTRVKNLNPDVWNPSDPKGLAMMKRDFMLMGKDKVDANGIVMAPFFNQLALAYSAEMHQKIHSLNGHTKLSDVKMYFQAPDKYAKELENLTWPEGTNKHAFFKAVRYARYVKDQVSQIVKLQQLQNKKLDEINNKGVIGQITDVGKGVLSGVADALNGPDWAALVGYGFAGGALMHLWGKVSEKVGGKAKTIGAIGVLIAVVLKEAKKRGHDIGSGVEDKLKELTDGNMASISGLGKALKVEGADKVSREAETRCEEVNLAQLMSLYKNTSVPGRIDLSKLPGLNTKGLPVGDGIIFRESLKESSAYDTLSAQVYTIAKIIDATHQEKMFSEQGPYKNLSLDYIVNKTPGLQVGDYMLMLALNLGESINEEKRELGELNLSIDKRLKEVLPEYKVSTGGFALNERPSNVTTGIFMGIPVAYRLQEGKVYIFALDQFKEANYSISNAQSLTPRGIAMQGEVAGDVAYMGNTETIIKTYLAKKLEKLPGQDSNITGATWDKKSKRWRVPANSKIPMHADIGVKPTRDGGDRYIEIDENGHISMEKTNLPEATLIKKIGDQYTFIEAMAEQGLVKFDGLTERPLSSNPNFYLLIDKQKVICNYDKKNNSYHISKYARAGIKKLSNKNADIYINHLFKSKEVTHLKEDVKSIASQLNENFISEFGGFLKGLLDFEFKTEKLTGSVAEETLMALFDQTVEHSRKKMDLATTLPGGLAKLEALQKEHFESTISKLRAIKTQLDKYVAKDKEVSSFNVTTIYRDIVKASCKNRVYGNLRWKFTEDMFTTYGKSSLSEGDAHNIKTALDVFDHYTKEVDFVDVKYSTDESNYIEYVAQLIKDAIRDGESVSELLNSNKIPSYEQFKKSPESNYKYGVNDQLKPSWHKKYVLAPPGGDITAELLAPGKTVINEAGLYEFDARAESTAKMVFGGLPASQSLIDKIKNAPKKRVPMLKYRLYRDYMRVPESYKSFSKIAMQMFSDIENNYQTTPAFSNLKYLFFFSMKSDALDGNPTQIQLKGGDHLVALMKEVEAKFASNPNMTRSEQEQYMKGMLVDFFENEVTNATSAVNYFKNPGVINKVIAYIKSI